MILQTFNNTGSVNKMLIITLTLIKMLASLKYVENYNFIFNHVNPIRLKEICFFFSCEYNANTHTIQIQILFLLKTNRE